MYLLALRTWLKFSSTGDACLQALLAKARAVEKPLWLANRTQIIDCPAASVDHRSERVLSQHTEQPDPCVRTVLFRAVARILHKDCANGENLHDFGRGHVR